MTPNNNKIIRGSASFQQQVGASAQGWLDMLGDSLNLGALIISSNNKILFYNRAFIDHCGLPETLVSNAGEIRDLFQFMFKRGDLALQDNGFIDRMLAALHTSSDSPSVLENVSPPNGNILEIRCQNSRNNTVTFFSEDVTEKRRSQESLNLALEIGKSGYFYHVMETDQTFTQSTYLDQLLTPNEMALVRSKGFWPIIHSDDKAKAMTIWRTTVLNGKSAELAVRIVTENHDDKTFRFNIRPSLSNNGKPIRLIGFFEDVTHEFNVRRAMKSAQQSTEQALQSKTQFLARISHEIRTPMNAVVGIADALIHHNKNPDIIPKLELIQNSAGGILNILDDTLNHTKLDSEHFSLDAKAGNPAQSVEYICALWQSKAEANNTTISLKIEDSVPREMIFDKHRYEQCLNNLLSNAIKFTPDGKIDVVATRIDKNGKPSLVVAVRDTGIGMTVEQKTRIFEPFKQADESISRRFGGTGLGMNITKSLIERMGGQILVKSEIGKGTIFVLSLPIELKEQKHNNATESLFEKIMAENSEPETPYQKLRILVADDNPTNHIVVKSLLDGMVSEIYTANDGQDVLDILQTREIDIVLMDIHMPVMDGIEATLAIRSSHEPWSDVKIIAVTADPQYQQQRLCMNIGMDFAVAKPVKLVDLLEAIDQVIAFEQGATNLRKTA